MIHFVQPLSDSPCSRNQCPILPNQNTCQGTALILGNWDLVTGDNLRSPEGIKGPSLGSSRVVCSPILSIPQAARPNGLLVVIREAENRPLVSFFSHPQSPHPYKRYGVE